MVERTFEGEEIDFHMLYDILLTNKDAKRFDNSNKGYDYDAIYLLDYKKEEDYNGPKYDVLEIELNDNTNNKFICSRFMTNKLNFEAETLKEALELKIILKMNVG